ncbi:ABC transporter permease [Streptococcaceae bacterium ESL0729]|nr:ABC transporter permease [Streptococcaceae bacterium ESL0729]
MNNISQVFENRRRDFHKKNIKYLRYVFNDHFVIVIFLLLGFLMIQYAQLVKNMPDHWNLGKVLVVLLSLISLFAGRLATFFEEADRLFLLAKEEQIKDQLIVSMKKSMIFPSFLFILLALILYPLTAKSFMLGLWILPVQVLSLIFLKVLLMKREIKSYYDKDGNTSGQGIFSWDLAISREEKRQASILKLYSQFVDIPGIKPAVKRRKYLDGLLKLVKKEHKYTYANLYLRHFLRTGDYLGLYMRLGLLSLALLAFVDGQSLIIPLIILLNFILIFQLMTLKSSYDYQLLSRIYPVSPRMRQKNLYDLLKGLLVVITCLQTLLAFLVFSNKLLVLLIPLGSLLILTLYVRAKVDSRDLKR